MIEQHLQTLLVFLRVHPYWAETLAFVAAFAESLPVVGTIVPGTITMTLVGMLIGVGIIPGVFTILLASLAAFIGDCIGFFLGRYYDQQIRNIWPFRKYPKWIELGENFFRKHGGKSIILGRFVGPGRSTIPLIAGLLRMSWPRFILAAIPSAVMWAMLYIIPGIILGVLSHEAPKGEATKFVLYGLAVFVVLWGTFWLIQHFFIQLTRLANRITDRTWNYLTQRQPGHFFIRYLTNQQAPTDHHQLTLFATACITLLLFFIVLLNVMFHTALININQPLFHLIQNVRTPNWNTFFVILTIIGQSKTLAVVTALVVAGLLLKKAWRAGAHFFIGFLLSAECISFFKSISHSVRPTGFEIVSASSSFPSGHTGLSLVVYILLAYFVACVVKKNYRWIPYTFSCVLVFLIAISRLYLGAHWFWDIIGSILLGTGIVLLTIVQYRRMPNQRGILHLNPLYFISICCVSMVISWSYFIVTTYHTNLFRYTPVWTTHTISIEKWWNNPERYTSLYRNDRLGKPVQPLNIQWQGDLQEITEILRASGWKLPEKEPKLRSVIQRISSLRAEYHTPILPWLHHNQPPVLFLMKRIPNEKRILELRLWKSRITLTPGNLPLWIGSLDVRIPPKALLSVKKRATITFDNTLGVRELMKNTEMLQRKKIIIENGDPSIKLPWTHQLLLIRDK